MLVLVLLFAIGGFLRGTIAQVFVVLGVLTGLWAAVFVSGWVGTHWHGARPAVAFLALRWLVAALAGLAVAALLQWWGDRLGKAVREGPLGWLDRGGGLVVGAGLGAIVGSFVLLGALTIQHPSAPGVAVAHARVAAPAMGVAAEVCSFGEAYLPGSGWLKQRFLAAKRRAVRIRESGSRSKTS
ncbi:MAG: CvpA family protein [Candidatus Eisenbacteria bacterium]